MRHISFTLCASITACGYVSLASATNPSLAFTLDLFSPCTQSGCGSVKHPTDIGLNVAANSFSFAPGTGGSFVATMDMSAPVVCDEVASGGTLGATSSLRLAPAFSNSAPGGLLEFNAGGSSIVDSSAINYDGNTPSGVAFSYSNGATPPQVVCYQINPISGGPLAYAAGPYGIFKSSFELHPAGEPWLSVQTVNSPGANASRPASGGVSGTASITPANTMGYVVQIHNANAAVGWRLDLGYDYAFFDPLKNGNIPTQWCVLGSGIPQPGPVNGTAVCKTVGSVYTLGLADIQTATNSVYIYVQSAGSTAATSSWSTLTSAFYPALAAVFPPYGTYPQRFDDKVAVASANNMPTPNIGSIVCNNDTVSTSCVIADQDGRTIPAALVFANTISANGTVKLDPLAYFVDPFSGTTLPGNVAADVLTVSGVACDDPSGILASPIGSGNFTTSPSAQGGKALGFGFKPSGSLYVPGTATCTATFAASGFAPSLSSTQSFTITMLPATVTHFAVSAPTSATAGAGFSFTVTAQDGANNTVADYSGSAVWKLKRMQMLSFKLNHDNLVAELPEILYRLLAGEARSSIQNDVVFSIACGHRRLFLGGLRPASQQFPFISLLPYHFFLSFRFK